MHTQQLWESSRELPGRTREPGRRQGSEFATHTHNPLEREHTLCLSLLHDNVGKTNTLKADAEQLMTPVCNMKSKWALYKSGGPAGASPFS